jgi:hypothetical protein
MDADRPGIDRRSRTVGGRGRLKSAQRADKALPRICDVIARMAKPSRPGDCGCRRVWIASLSLAMTTGNEAPQKFRSPGARTKVSRRPSTLLRGVSPFGLLITARRRRPSDPAAAATAVSSRDSRLRRCCAFVAPAFVGFAVFYLLPNLGGSTQIYGRAKDGGSLTVLAHQRASVASGDRLEVSLGAGLLHVFDAAGLSLQA